MLFNSAAFAIFLPLMLAVYWSLRGAQRRYALLFGSYLFYGWWDWRFLGLLALSTLVSYWCALAIEKRNLPSSRRRILGINIAANLVSLGAFKYFDFFRDAMVRLGESAGLDLDVPVFQIILPMGISFYTFQAVSYTIDVYRGARAERDLGKFALFISCFPQLVAGPIMRAGDFLPQLSREPRLDSADFSEGVYRVFRGLFKKMVIADTLALYVDMVFQSSDGYAGVSAWIALYAYAFQIYMDFSGYCDVAVGVGLLLGLRLNENFNQPYLACSPSEFWRRWHITLSTWLRDYLYIPLGGSRGGRLLTLRNVFITMALGGLWHGAAWTFVAWGAYQGLLLIGERLLRGNRRPIAPAAMPAAMRLLRVTLMFHLTCLGWLLFRSPDWHTVAVMGANLIDFSGQGVHGLRVAVLVVACAVAHALPATEGLRDRFARVPGFGQGALAAVCMWALVVVGTKSQSFIYFQF